MNHNVVVVLISSLSFIRGGVGASERREPIWEAKTSEAHHEVSYLECMAVATASTWVTSGRLSGSGVMQSATTALSKYFKIKLGREAPFGKLVRAFGQMAFDSPPPPNR